MRLVRNKILLSILVVLAFSVAAPLANIASAQTVPIPPREETLVVGGGLWSPPTTFNPLVPWSAVPGVTGVIYETLYLYLPHNATWIPWLADGMPQWINSTALQIKLKGDAYWWDGQPITSKDVRFTFYEVPELTQWSVYYSGIRQYLLDVATPDDRTVIFVLNRSAINYPYFYSYLHNMPILPEHALRSFLQQKGSGVLQLNVLGADKPEDIVGSGMYKVYFTTSDTLWYVRNDNWWGKKYFGLPAPKYIKYVMVTSNQVALAMLTTGDLDWSNFFLPGVPTLIKQYNWLVTWYKNPPYYLPAAVLYLFVNHAKKPFNDTAFRKAIYYAIDINRIINEVYEGAAERANPVGLLPLPGYKDFLAEDLVAKYNYTYDPEKAKSILDAAGYKVGPDGWRRAPDGSPIVVRVECPYGWTDWMQIALIIVQNLQAIGINAQPYFPAYSVYNEELYKGEFDMLLNNFGSYIDVSPYLLYNWLLWPNAPAVGQYSWGGNYGRYYNNNVTEILSMIANTPLNDKSTLMPLYRQLQEILLEEVPYIPLIWWVYLFQASTLHWTGWPTADNPYGVPTTWIGHWTRGGVLVLLNLKPVTKTTTSPQIITVTSVITQTSVVTERQVQTQVVTMTTSVVTSKEVTVITTATTSPAPAAPGVSMGLIAGIAVAVIVILAALFLLLRRRR